MSRTVHRSRLNATIEGDVEYDTADPASYTKALQAVADKRTALKAAGAEITLDRGKPVTVRE